tara:strand:- start:35 stop:616 length:582 start_codon:yes stop_codon:yes gene_type:complete
MMLGSLSTPAEEAKLESAAKSREHKLPRLNDTYPDMENVLQKGAPGMCDSGRLMLFANMGDLSNPNQQLSYVDSMRTAPPKGKNLDANPSVTNNAWINWNQQIAKEINRAFSRLTDRVDAKGKLIVSQADFVISPDRKVLSIKVRDHCPSKILRSMIISTLESLNGNSVLQYPDGANWTEAPKSGRFVQNYGQ